MSEQVLDTLGMWDAAAKLPEQVATAADAVGDLAGLPPRGSIANVVVLGMGGSGIAGDVFQATAGPEMEVPVSVVKSYCPPRFVGPASLVFAVSFSGDTEETVEAAKAAVSRGATVVVVTSGGELAALADDWGAPALRVPDTIPQPRAAVGAMAVPLLAVAEDLGLLPDARRRVDHAVAQLQRRRDQLVGPASPAAALARRIGRTIPIIYGAAGIGSVAAWRWKADVNENAKAPAFAATQPELCHNEVAGWGQHGDVTRQLLTLVNLRHRHEHPRVARRFGLVDDIVREVVAGIEEVAAEGEGPLAQLLDLVMVGDFCSLHLAAQEGLDPGPVPALAEIKSRLTAGPGGRSEQ
ncbi:MAG TPA: bifunctional phosphoglucose/phosphomannose isomerase [Acidimicrobiales bacterium]|nr:bifunctional phosphoglucose/phosphomannose isomerase [Acidimicrobiales bacterium]